MKKRKKEKDLIEIKSNRLIAGSILISLAIILFLGLIHAAGPVGYYLAHFLQIIFGWSSWAIFIVLLVFGFYLLKLTPEKKLSKRKIYAAIVLVLILATLFHIFFLNDKNSLKKNYGGGYVGYAFAWIFNQLFGVWTSVFLLLIAFFVLLTILVIKTKKTKKISPEEKISFLQTLKEKVAKKNKLIRKSEQGIKKIPQESKEIIEINQVSPDKKLPILSSKIKNKKQKFNLPLDLLELGSVAPDSGNIKANKLIIQRTLKNFGIDVEMGEVKVGPTVTQYTLKPADGVKLSQITSLHNDLALALAAHPIRIEAPIPGRSLVGVEVPNQKIAVVRLREILESQEFKRRKSNLTIGLGKDVAGNIWLADLGKMPHLLVAGATGSGKTVMLNSIIIALLYQNSPDDLRFILVDPKRVELTLYNDLPHLLTPVITNVNETVNALKWSIREMKQQQENYLLPKKLL